MSNTVRRDIKFWSRTAENYDTHIRMMAENTNKLIKMRLKKDITECENLLELGCGTGIFTDALIDISRNLIATDYSDKMLDVIREKYKGNNAISFSREDCQNLSFSNNTFDCVFIGNTLHILPEPTKCLDEIWRVLKPDGKIIVSSYSKQKSIKAKLRTLWNFLRYGIPTVMRNVTVEEMSGWIEKSGFSIFVFTNIQGTPDELNSIYIGGIKQ
jgi:ubiquinone/menaquinone biosynthesis C-methylase UbiE